jgi:hypothetical protein
MSLIAFDAQAPEERKTIRQPEPLFLRVVICIDKVTRRFCRVLDERATWFLAGVLVLCFGASTALDYCKLLWFDALCTYSIATLPSASEIWSKLASGIGPMPPSVYLYQVVIAVPSN